MPPLALLAIEIVASFVALGVLALTVGIPRLRAMPRHRAVVPLLWVHALRHAPLALLAPGQMDPGVSDAVASTIAWGDFTSFTFALLALVALHLRGRRALSFVWLFSAVSSIDIALALAAGLGTGVYARSLGVGWYVLTLYVPVVCVAQALVFWVLARRERSRPELSGARSGERT
ncbi:MAG: hypothetical protein AB7S26_01130 [Sandaracinaceae bacterium]